MAYPSSIDAFAGTTAQGTSLLSSPDHSLDHRTLGSAASALEQKVGVGAGTPVANRILVGSGNGTSVWGTEWDNAILGTPQINGGTVTGGLIGTSSIVGGTVSAALLGTNSIIDGTIQNSLIGTSTVTGGTITTVLLVRRAIGSTAYTGTASGTTTLDLSTATRFLITMPNSAGSVTLAVSNVVANQPFITEILQGTAGLGTIGWFSTIRWAGSAVPTLTTTANRKDTFGFVPTSGTTFDGYIVGQNV